ncbi:hypothetical protein GCK32_002486 [Trichostrongylus colubriformis]|uniref:Uncharacterized protein n=1 Tax=Trichostrongylus colubriformis TaxID=6319 RepID=A0AAN8F6E4_TRICO
MAACETSGQENQQEIIGPVEALLRQSTTATHRAVNAIRAADAAKESLRTDINSLTTSFDSTIQKSLALIDRLDESVYSGRIDNAHKRAKIEKEANAIIQQAYSNPIENADLRLFERTVDVLRDSAVGLHREYFSYDGTVDAKDVLAQVIEYKYRTSALEKNVSRRRRVRAGTSNSLYDLLEDISESLEEFLQSHVSIKAQASTIIRTVNEMKMKLANGMYGAEAMSASAYASAPETHSSIVEATTSGYTL